MYRRVIAFFCYGLIAVTANAGDVLHVKKVDKAPRIDGVMEELWKNAKPLKLKLSHVPDTLVKANQERQKSKYAKHWGNHHYTKVDAVELRALYTDDRIFILAQWQDATKDDQHKPWKWKGTKQDGEYVAGEEREDRIALSFPISGKFTNNKLSGVESVMDVWHWKAYRTNGIGISHDKTHVVSKTRPLGKSSIHYDAQGHQLFLARPGDGGVSPYKTRDIDPFTYQGDVVPRYEPFKPDVPDAVDVTTKGVWKDGQWTVEFSRKLDTGHRTTDTLFEPQKGSFTSVAVFDHVGDHFHALSDVVKIVFE